MEDKNKAIQDEAIRANVNETIKDMTLEDLMLALEEQNNGLYKGLHEIILSQIDVIKSQQEEISRNRDMISSLVNTVNKVNAHVQVVVQKQKDLEEYALIASGVKKVAETTVGMKHLVEKGNEYIDAQEIEEAKEEAEKQAKEDKKKSAKDKKKK